MNFVYSKNNVLSKEQCEDIIDFYEKSNDKRPGHVGIGVHDPTIKDSIDISLPEIIYNSNCKSDEITALISSTLYKQLVIYSKNINTNYNNYLIFKNKPIQYKGAVIAKYNKNKGKYIYHTDLTINQNSHRVITFVFYLNDVFEGGETEFLGGDFSIKPEHGKLLLFPSSRNFPHRGNIPISNDKYIISGWLETSNTEYISKNIFKTDFDINGYIVLKDVLDKNILKYIQIQCKILEKIKVNNNSDSQVKECFSIYGDVSSDSLLLLLQPIIEDSIKQKLEPTYSYIRIYYKDALLEKHTDRESCEISVTICIKNDKYPWDIWFEINHEKKYISLNEGDMIIYKGIELPHGRDKYTRDEHIQIFLHYIIKNGSYDSYKFDKRKFLGISLK